MWEKEKLHYLMRNVAIQTHHAKLENRLKANYSYLPVR
jgi:hypothetical protein